MMLSTPVWYDWLKGTPKSYKCPGKIQDEVNFILAEVYVSSTLCNLFPMTTQTKCPFCLLVEEAIVFVEFQGEIEGANKFIAN